MKKSGRPSKYKDIDLAKVEELAGYGLIDTQIASVLNICRATLNKYKKNPEFIDTLKRGKAKADTEVVKSLYKRALGFEYDEIHRESVEILQPGTKSLKLPAKKIKTITKLVYPDTTACIFWLKNRDPDNWRDKQEIGGSIGIEVTNIEKMIQDIYGKGNYK